jgi:rhodanese-related sulfurtransferase
MAATPDVVNLSCAHLKAKMDAGEDLWLVDCREQDEYDTVKIAEATLVPMSEITERLADFEPHREQLIVVHCHHGGRSLRVVNWLLKQGFPKVMNLAGGIDKWAEEIDPALPRY